jgi:hypothetical protein
MRKFTVWLAGAALVLACAARSNANTVTLTFEGLQDNEQILNFYNGGLGGSGSGPGPNYGIIFGADSLALNSGNYSNNPTPPGVCFFLTGPGDIMNVPAGFNTGFSFYYSAAVYTGSVTVYDGLNGTGNVLASLPLGLTPTLPPGSPTYNNWQPVGVNFAGTAMSVNFSGVANYIGFDNVTLGSDVPTSQVPEPFTLATAALSLAGLGGYLRRRRSE